MLSPGNDSCCYTFSASKLVIINLFFFPLVSNNQTVFGTKKVSLASEMIVIVGMSFTVLFANVLLVNILIAVFGYVIMVTLIGVTVCSVCLIFAHCEIFLWTNS